VNNNTLFPPPPRDQAAAESRKYDVDDLITCLKAANWLEPPEWPKNDRAFWCACLPRPPPSLLAAARTRGGS
jgi:hypothetical protein